MRRGQLKVNLYVVLAVLVSVTPQVREARAQAALFDKTWGGPFVDNGSALAVDPTGNIYVGGGTGSFEGLSGFLLKYDSGGNLIWQRVLSLIVSGLALDQEGNIYAVGILVPGLPLVVSKFDRNGTPLWHRSLRSELYSMCEIDVFETCGEVATDSTGSVYVASAPTILRTNGDRAAFLAKLDGAGNVIWQRHWEHPNARPLVTGIAVAATGDMYMATTGFLLKYDANGNLVWDRALSSQFPQGVALDLDGNIYVVGRCSSKYCIIKYDAAGNPLWQQTWDADGPQGVTVDSAGNIYVIATTYRFGAGSNDFLLLRFDDHGNLIWQRTFGGPDSDDVSAVAAGPLGRIYATGRTGSAVRVLGTPTLAVAGAAVTSSPVGGISVVPPLAVGSPEISVAIPDGSETFTGTEDVLVLALQDYTMVPIDIKPGSDPNSINLGSEGVVPVAILTTATFDAAEVDPVTITLAGAEVRLKGKSGHSGSLQDVDGDGDLDLVVQLEINQLELTEGSTQAVLIGKTLSGLEIQGVDSVRVVRE